MCWGDIERGELEAIGRQSETRGSYVGGSSEVERKIGVWRKGVEEKLVEKRKSEVLGER